MQSLAERQREFAAALLDSSLATPPGLVGPDGEASQQRFAVYRNNVVAGLTEALQDSFPAVSRIVGAEFFRAMARAYVVSEPPSTPILLEYGARFPDFISKFQPAATLPYLPDVARIERAWTEAYHSSEALPLDPAVFMAIEPDQLSQICLLPHPSARLVRSELPALTIWRMNIGDSVPTPVDLTAGGEDVLVVRPIAEVEVRSMPQGGFEFVQALVEGKSVLTATTAAMMADCHFDLSAHLSELIGAGAFVGHSFAFEPAVRKSTWRA